MWVLKIFRLVLAVMESRDGYNKGVASSPGVTSAVIICEAKMINMLNKQELKDKKKNGNFALKRTCLHFQCDLYVL